MDIENIVEVSSICHACLSLEDISYFEKGTMEYDYLINIFETLISVPMKEIDNTLALCKSCLVRLNEIRNFQDMCLKTYTVLFKSTLGEGKTSVDTSNSSGVNTIQIENNVKSKEYEMRDEKAEINKNIVDVEYCELPENYEDYKKLDYNNCLSDRYGCSECEKYYTSPLNLKIHMYHHIGVKPYTCTICQKSFMKKSTLKAHLTIHTGIRDFLCSECGKGFTSITVLNRHKLVHSGKKPFKCDLCTGSFIQATDLNVHMRTHTGEKPFLCSTCGKSFRRDTQLSVHMRIHTGEKPYCCETCGRSFAQSGDLKAHMRIHTGEKPYECRVCDKKFAQCSGLSTHLKKHFGPLLNCTICEKKFTSAKSSANHSLTHEKEK